MFFQWISRIPTISLQWYTLTILFVNGFVKEEAGLCEYYDFVAQAKKLSDCDRSVYNTQGKKNEN